MLVEDRPSDEELYKKYELLSPQIRDAFAYYQAYFMDHPNSPIKCFSDTLLLDSYGYWNSLISVYTAMVDESNPANNPGTGSNTLPTDSSMLLHVSCMTQTHVMVEQKQRQTPISIQPSCGAFGRTYCLRHHMRDSDTASYHTDLPYSACIHLLDGSVCSLVGVENIPTYGQRKSIAYLPLALF